MEKEIENAASSSSVRCITKFCAFLGFPIIFSYIFTGGTEQFDNHIGFYTVIRSVRNHSELISDLQWKSESLCNSGTWTPSTLFFFFLRYLLPSEVVFSQTWRWNSCSFDDLYMSDIAFCIVIFSLRRFGLLWSHCWAVWKKALALVEELDSQAWTSYSQGNKPGVLQMLPVRTHIHRKIFPFGNIVIVFLLLVLYK